MSNFLERIGQDKIEDREEIESLRQQLAEFQATNGNLREALEFYADQNHVECLSGKRDWIADRKALADRGFRFEGESANGDETYIEYGLTAEQALALPNDATALNELIAERTANLTAEVEKYKSGWRDAFRIGMKHQDERDELRQQNAELTSKLQATRLQMITDFGQYQEAHEKVKELTVEVERLKADIEFATNARIQDAKDATANCKQWNAELTAEVERLKPLSVENILIDVVPGDGSGQEVYAKSVDDVISVLTRLGEKAEDYDAEVPQLRQQNTELTAQRDAAMKDAERWRKARKTGVAKRGATDLIVVYNKRADETIDTAIANKSQ